MKKIHFKKHEKTWLWVFVLSPWINVWAAKSFSRWTKLIDHEELSSKTCSECFSDSYSPLKFQFYKTPVSIVFLMFSKIFFFDRFYHYFHDLCSFFCNNLLFSSLFRNLEQIFRHLGFISGFGWFTWQDAYHSPRCHPRAHPWGVRFGRPPPQTCTYLIIQY